MRCRQYSRSEIMLKRSKQIKRRIMAKAIMAIEFICKDY